MSPGRMTDGHMPSPESRLTPRQAEVLELVGKGLTNREVGGVLEISPATVKRHVSDIIEALDVTNRTEAVAFARDQLTSSGAPTRDRALRSIAVLPLENLSSNADDEYFSDGLTDLLIGALATLGGLRVISRTSVAGYKRSARSVRDIATALAADVIVEGTVQRIGDRVCVSVQLIDAQADAHLWADRIERNVRDVLTLQRSLALSIAKHVHIDLSLREIARLETRQSVEPDVLEDLLRSAHLVREDRLDLGAQATSLLERVVRRAPDFAGGHVALASALLTMAETMNLPAGMVKERVSSLIDHALDADPYLASAFTCRGSAKAQFEWNWAGAQRDVARGLELAPSEIGVNLGYASIASISGRHTEAITACERACRSGPTDTFARTSLALCLYLARRFQQAIQQLEWLRQSEGQLSQRAQIYEIWCYLAVRRYTDARKVLVPSDATDDGLSPAQTGLRDAFAQLGLGPDDPVSGEAWAEAHRITLGNMTGTGQPPMGRAHMAMAAGLPDDALASIEQAIDEVIPSVQYLGVSPLFDSLRAHPRFSALLGRIGWTKALESGIVFATSSPRQPGRDADATASIRQGSSAPSIAATSVNKAPEGTVTVMFTDIVGFTAMTERLGDWSAREIVREHNTIVREAVRAHAGHELELMGDGFLLSFAGASPAIQCAIDIQRALEQRNTNAVEPLAVRMGLHTGEVLMDDDGPFGKTVIVASRIASKAQGHEILTSALLHALTVSTGEHTFMGPRSLALKGIAEPQPVYSIDWRSLATSSESTS